MRSQTGGTSALLLAALLAGCGGGGGAAASCVGPTVTLTPARAAVGEDVTVRVEWLREGCNDHTGADEERPLTDVPVTFVQGDTRVPLGTVSGAGDHHAGTLTAPLPEAAPGAASIELGVPAEPAELTVLP
jgi:hypothetical protein